MYFTDQKSAYNYAVEEARKTNQIFRLCAGHSHNNKPGFYVNRAVQDKRQRFGAAARGVFVKPSDPDYDLYLTIHSRLGGSAGLLA